MPLNIFFRKLLKALRNVRKSRKKIDLRSRQVELRPYSMKVKFNKDNYEAARKILDETPSVDEILVKAAKEALIKNA